MGGVGVLAAALTEGARAQSSDALLDVLIKNGIITQDQAQQVRAQAQAEQETNTAAITSKWKLSNGIKSVELFGDIRFRYEYRSAATPYGDDVTLERYRYALRFGLRGEVLDNFYYGFRLDTAANSRSPWVTFGTSTSGTPYQGPFGKSSAGLDVGQVYVGWKPASWLDVTVGKMPNPMYTTPMTWDTDINPEGLAEHLKFPVGEADLFANFGQFIYQDTNPNQASVGFIAPGFLSQGQDSANAFMLSWQAGMNYHIQTNISLKLAATLYNYTGHGASSGTDTTPGTPGFNNTFEGEGLHQPIPATINSSGQQIGPNAKGSSGFNSGPNDGFFYNQTGINDLLIIDFPFELNFKLAGLNTRIFGDFAENLEGSARARNAAAAFNSSGVAVADQIPVEKDQIKAYQLGLALGHGDLGMVYGTTVKKHAWEARAYWQHVEQYALDPNLIDSDFFEGRGNLQGVYAAFAYGLSDNIIGTLRGGYATRIDDKLGTGGSNQDLPQVNPINRYQILQFDLTYKF